MTKKKAVQLLLLILLILSSAFLCLYNLSKASFERWDEQIYYYSIQETKDSGQFLTLIYKGEPFFEKPPLWFWITMVPVNIFGLSLTTVRLVSALSGIFSVLITYLIGKKLFSKEVGLLAGFILLATRHLFLKSPIVFSTHNFRSADLDSLQLFLILLTVLFIIYYLKSNFENKKWLMLSAASTALAFLAKGPMAFIPLIVLSLYMLVNKEKLKIGVRQIIKEIFIFVCISIVIILPWHVYMYFLYQGDFLYEYLNYHILSRTFQSLEGHSEPWYFYFNLILRKDFFFSGGILVLSMIYLFLKYKMEIVKKISLFTIIISPLIIFIIITLMGTKLSWYMLPIYPFLALIIAVAYEKALKLNNRVSRVFISLVLFIPLVYHICLNFIQIIYL